VLIENEWKCCFGFLCGTDKSALALPKLHQFFNAEKLSTKDKHDCLIILAELARLSVSEIAILLDSFRVDSYLS